MRFYYLLFTFCLLSSSIVSAQIKISGQVKDSTENKLLSNAIVYIINPKDSVIEKFVRTNEKGIFSIDVQQENNIIIITSPKYADYFLRASINKDTSLGIINMITVQKLLAEVIVKAQAASIKQRGDTLAYVADSFAVRKGASVEELLKRLPGITVDKNGAITAQGERVNKVLVDGEEFFGEDPTVATQNLSAASVKEVQVFDKKSDQAVFTGVDDGQKQRTINLKLKENAKKGAFGKVQAAGGLPDKFENTLFFNNFKNKQKISVIGIAANTGRAGLTRSEELNFGGRQTGDPFDFENTNRVDADGNNGRGSFAGQGIPTNYTLGGQYSNKYNKDRSSINGNARFQQTITKGNANSFTEFILPDSSFTNNQKSSFTTNQWKQTIQFRNELFIDSSQSFIVSFNGSIGESNSNNKRNTEAITGKNTLLNKGERELNTQSNIGTITTTALWRKRFKKPRQTISFNINQSYNSNKGNSFLLNKNEFLFGPSISFIDTVDQFRNTNNQNLQIDAKLAFTQPVGKKGIVEISYGYAFQNSENKRFTFNKNNEKYTLFDSALSNNTNFDINSNRIGLGYRYSYKKITWGLGSDVVFADWKVKDPIQKSNTDLNFTNLFPRANLNIKTSTFGGFDISYNGTTRPPSINQIQPLTDNSDPLNIVVGNPALVQSFSNSFSTRYNVFKPTKQRAIQAVLRYTKLNNDFSQKDFIDSLGRRNFQTVNVDGNYNINFFYYFFFKWKKVGADVNFNLRANNSVNNNFINGIANKNTNNIYGFGISFSKVVLDDYSISINNNFNYTKGSSSLRKVEGQNYWTAEPAVEFSYNLPLNTRLITDVTYLWRQKTVLFNQNNNVWLWNARVEKKLLKKQDLKLGFKVNDLLNQSIGFTRFVNSNFIAENNFDVLRRFWLVTLNWNFNKGPFKEDRGF